jgi:hypothetical protein
MCEIVVAEKLWVMLSSRRLETRDQSENQKKYNERFVIQKEFNVWTD